MRVLLRLQQPSLPAGGNPFLELGSRWPSIRSLGLSFCAHAALVGALSAVSFPASPVPSRSSREHDPTQIRIGDHLYYVARIPPREDAPVQAPRAVARTAALRTPVAPAPPAAPERPAPPAPAAEQEKHGPAPRPFIPPEFKRDPIAEQTLIQPDSAPNLRPNDPNLPSFRIWAAQIPKIPKPFVAPGRREPQPEQPQLLAEPSFDVAAQARPSNQFARLTLPRVPAPLDLPPAPEIPQLSAGDPVNIVSLSNQPALPVDLLKVPAGNVVAPDKAASGGNAAGAGLTASNTPAVNPNPVPPASAGRANSPASDAKPAAAAVASAAPAGKTPAAAPSSGGKTPDSVLPEGAASGGTNGITITGAAGPAPSALPKATVITRPANGNFDTVVVQSSPLDLFPEGRNLLTGRPVYTVYIAVGTAKDWPLYFCIPGEKPADSAAVGGIVQLTSAPPVRAPYPTRIVRPDVKLPIYEKYVLLHGYVMESGRFRDIRVVNPGRAEADQAILAALSGWEFRPGERDGVPIMVEVLLAIPAAGL